MAVSGEKTDFEYRLGSRFSIAYQIARTALDTEIESSSPLYKGQFPPVLSAGDITRQIVINSADSLTSKEEDALCDRIKDSVTLWASQGIFELLPLPNKGTDDKTGYRITSQGIKLALESFRLVANDLSLTVDTAESAVTQ